MQSLVFSGILDNREFKVESVELKGCFSKFKVESLGFRVKKGAHLDEPLFYFKCRFYYGVFFNYFSLGAMTL